MGISYKDLIVWQKSIELCKQVYLLTGNFPQSEKFGLSSQMQRAAVSISSNVAEGKYRASKKAFTGFLRIAFSSGAELETQLIIAEKVFNIPADQFVSCNKLLSEVMRMLNVMIYKRE